MTKTKKIRLICKDCGFIDTLNDEEARDTCGKCGSDKIKIYSLKVGDKK